jgi:serine/threonine-protein kinase
MVRGQAPIPETIGRFRIEAVLGRGGMGEVYKALDPTLQRTVAVKTVRPDIDRPEYLERMMREAQACARLSHPNIVTVFEAGQAEGVVFIAMEFLQGENLAEVLEKHALPFDEKIRILTKVLDALQHAHNLDIVHRDIKPSNIHVQADGTIKLMDFGLARMLTADTLTASGNVLGTPHYASPEQLKGQTIDRRSDIYSTGVMAYEMLSGRRPFEPDNDSISSVIIKVISEAPRPMNTDVTRMLPEIEAIVSKAMAKLPEDRYQSADEMRRALSAFLDSSRAKLSAIDSLAGATVMLPVAGSSSAASTSQDFVPTLVGSQAPPQSQWQSPSQSESQSQSQAQLQPQPPSTAKWWWAGVTAAAAIVGAALVLGWPTATAENAASPAASPVSTAPAPAIPAPALADSPATPGNAALTTPAVDATAKPPAPNARAAAKTDAVAPPIAVAAKPVESGAIVPVSNAGAKAMFASTTATNVAPGLRFRMILEGPDSKPMDVDPARDFHTGNRIKFAFESNVDGYLYVAQQGTSGNWTVLFPHPDINGGRNQVKRFEEHEVPNDNYFTVAGNPGEEHIFVFLSREPLRTLPGFDRPVKAFETGSPTLVATLASSIQSRDLVLEKDRASGGKGPQATYIVNKAELGKAVTANFTLNHKP